MFALESNKAYSLVPDGSAPVTFPSCWLARGLLAGEKDGLWSRELDRGFSCE